MLLPRYSCFQTTTLNVAVSCLLSWTLKELIKLLNEPHFVWTHPAACPLRGWSLTSFCLYSLQCSLAVCVCLLIQPFSAWAWSRSRYRGRYKRGREEPAHSSVGGWSLSGTLQDSKQAAPPHNQLCSVNTHIHWSLSSQALILKMETLHYHHRLLSGEQRWELRGGRGTCWTRCDQPVWGNVTESDIYFITTGESFILNRFNTCWRLARDASGQMSPPSATSWPPETTCSFRLRSRCTSRWVWLSTAVVFNTGWPGKLASIVSLASCPWVDICLS